MSTPVGTEPSTAVPQLTAGLLRHDGWTREQLLAHQRDRLEALLRHAAAHAPYYRDALGDEPWTRPLAELPVLTKQTLMDNWEDVVTDRALRLGDAEGRLSAPDYDGTVAPGVHACATSGTTGRRGVFVLTGAELDVWTAANARAMARIGVGPQTRVCAVGSPSPVHMSRQVFARLAGEPPAVAPEVSVLTPVPELAAHAQALQPEALVGYPTVIAALADEQLRGRLDISPRCVGTASEVLSDDAVQRITAAWGVEPREAYPTTEAPMIASGHPADRDLFVNEDLVIIEVVDADDRPVAPGTPGHRVLLTNLVNQLQPLIRYELADAVTLAARRAGESLPYARIARIEGRTSDILELPAASGAGTVRLHPHRLRRAFAHLPEVAVHQLRVAPDRLTARIVPARGAMVAGLAQRVEEALTGELRAAGARLPVGVELVSGIERDPRKAGKLPAVVVD